MTARQIEEALLAAAPEERFPLAVRLIAMALAEDEVLSPCPDPNAGPDDGKLVAGDH
jgi:hypothetical protein